METQKQYPAIDVCRFIFACLIPFLHIDFGSNIFVEIIRSISHLGVPFFFVAAGFFFEEKISNRQAVKSTIWRLLFLFVFWSGVYFPKNILSEIRACSNIMTAVTSYIQQVLFRAPSYMWYLVALIVALLIVSYSIKQNSWEVLFVLSVLYIVGTLGNSYRGVCIPEFTPYYDLFLTTRNGLFFAPIFVFIGVLLHQKRGALASRFRYNFLFNIAITTAAFVIYMAESLWVKRFAIFNDTSMYFSLPVLMYLIFRLLTCTSISGEAKNNFRYLRSASLMIYCSQFGFMFVYSYILRKLFTIGAFYSGWIVWSLTICSAMLATYVIQCSKIKCLKRLI